MEFDSRTFRDALGCFATGVCVVTCCGADGKPHGVTVNSFSSVSLEPPLVLFSLDRSAACFDPFQTARHVAIHVLRQEQVELSRNFGSPGEKWDGIAFEIVAEGYPLLPHCLATFEGSVVARHEGGDHVIMVVRVERLHTGREGTPLLYFRGRYASLD